jgi:hypothetical protein
MDLEHSLNGDENWTVRKVDQKYLESFEKLWWSRMEKIVWPDRVGIEGLPAVKEERNILLKVKK